MLRDVLIKSGLSNREAEVAGLVSKGLSNKEVASQLFVTEKTVKFHLTNIYKKMNVKSRAQLIVWCLPHIDFTENTKTPAADNTLSAGVQTSGSGNGASAVKKSEATLIPGQGGLPPRTGNGNLDQGSSESSP